MPSTERGSHALDRNQIDRRRLVTRSLAHGADEAAPLWLTARGTQPPRFYLFWQSGDPRTPRIGQTIREVAPDLLQDAGLRRPHESMRPAPEVAFGGWAYKPDVDARKPKVTGPDHFTPEAYARRLAEGKAENKYRTGQLGVHGTCPYVCAVKIEGDHQRRLGFWAFYDRWDDYRPFGFGPRPDTDPWDWIQMRPGNGQRHLWAFYKPAADGSVIYSGCPNSPFSQYLANLVCLLARSGDRGVFVDNPGVACFCPWCQTAWRQYLRDRFTPAELQNRFGIERYEDARLGQPPFQVESQRFWSVCEGRHLGRLREAGESVWGQGRFWVAPNGSGIVYQPTAGGLDPVEWARAGGVQIAVRECNRVVEGYESRALTGSLRFNETDDLILGHRMMRGIRSAQVWAAPLRSSAFLGGDANMYNLAAAETLAFDGVLCDTGPYWLPTAARKPFVGFYRRFESLLRSGPAVADVAVLSMINDTYAVGDKSGAAASPAEAVREVRAVTDWLSEARVEWVSLLDDGITFKDLAPNKAVFVPQQRRLDDDQVAALKAYVASGGLLILSGRCGIDYRCGAARSKPAFADIVPNVPPGQSFAVAPCGQGRIAWCPQGFADVDVPAAYRGADAQTGQPARGLIAETSRRTFLACLDQTVSHGLSAILPPGPGAVRIASRWFPTGEGTATMTVHLANYNLRATTTLVYIDRILTAPTELRSAVDVRVAVPVPDSWHATGVKIASLPSPLQTTVGFTACQGGVAFTVPRVESYTVAAVELARGPSSAQMTLATVRGRHTSVDGALPLLEFDPYGPPARPVTDDPPTDSSLPLAVVPGVPVTLNAEKGRPLELHLCTSQGTGSQEVVYMQDAVTAKAQAQAADWLRFWLLSPSGKIVLSGAVPAQQATALKLPAEESGFYVLVTEPGPGKLLVRSPSRFLVAVAQPLSIEPTGQRLYFFVPAGVSQFQLAPRTNLGHYAGRWRVFDASGRIVVDRRNVNVHPITDTIQVPPGQAGRVWSLCYETTTPVRFTVDLSPPLPGYAAVDPTRLVMFAGHNPVDQAGHRQADQQ